MLVIYGQQFWWTVRLAFFSCPCDPEGHSPTQWLPASRQPAVKYWTTYACFLSPPVNMHYFCLTVLIAVSFHHVLSPTKHEKKSPAMGDLNYNDYFSILAFMEITKWLHAVPAQMFITKFNVSLLSNYVHLVSFVSHQVDKSTVCR